MKIGFFKKKLCCKPWLAYQQPTLIKCTKVNYNGVISNALFEMQIDTD